MNQAALVFQSTLGANLDAIYLHGSLAMGCFYPPKSDVDLLILVSDPIKREEHRILNEALLSVNDQRPMTGSLELSVVLSSIARHPKHPIPYELHFGDNLAEAVRLGTFDYRRNDMQVDSDLAAHFMVAKKRGIVLFG